MATTISISEDTRDKIKDFGTKGETYDDIINKLYNSACRNMLDDYLNDSSNSVSIDDALKEAMTKWS